MSQHQESSKTVSIFQYISINTLIYLSQTQFKYKKYSKQSNKVAHRYSFIKIHQNIFEK